MAAADNQSVLSIRLSGVKGQGEKSNDVFVYGRAKDASDHIIFFGGDCQDYPENMERHRVNKHYVAWNTERTAERIHRAFPSSLVFVIKPLRMHLLNFAVYSNFIESNDFGSPSHCENHGAIEHLHQLYTSAVSEVYGEQGLGIPQSVPIRLMGFSKGCVVLNQIVYELHLLQSCSDLREFVSKISAFYWFDGAHNGGPDKTWVTEDKPLQNLASLNVDIYIHVTPYIVRDPMRVWVGQQESKFYKKLKSLKAKVREVQHFMNEPASLEYHFQVLEEF